MEQNEHQEIQILVADESHEKYVDTILKTIEDAAKVRGTGIAKRTHEYVATKMREAKAVIALAPQADGSEPRFAGFSYIETWGNKQYVTTSGLIVHPDFRGLGIAKKIKDLTFSLARTRWPHANEPNSTKAWAKTEDQESCAQSRFVAFDARMLIVPRRLLGRALADLFFLVRPEQICALCEYPRQDDSVVHKSNHRDCIADKVWRQREIGQSAGQQCDLRGWHLALLVHHIGEDLVCRNYPIGKLRERFRAEGLSQGLLASGFKSLQRRRLRKFLRVAIDDVVWIHGALSSWTVPM